MMTQVHFSYIFVVTSILKLLETNQHYPYLSICVNDTHVKLNTQHKKHKLGSVEKERRKKVTQKRLFKTRKSGRKFILDLIDVINKFSYILIYFKKKLKIF